MKKHICTAPKWLFAIALLGFTFLGYGQDQKQQTRLFSAQNGASLRVDYDYTLLKKDTVLNGLYQIQVLPNLTDNRVKLQTLSVNFEKGEMQGLFSLKEAILAPSSENDFFEDYLLVQSTDGTGKELTGMVKNNLPSGKWTLDRFTISAASKDSTLSSTALNYDSGQLSGDFQFGSLELGRKLTGKLENGYPVGKWIYQEQKDISNFELLFENGELHKVSFAKAEDITLSGNAEFKEMPLDNSLSEILYYSSFSADLTKEERQNYQLHISHINEILRETHAFLVMEEFPFSKELPKNVDLGNIQIKLPNYPIGNIEKETLNQLVASYETLSERFESAQKNNTLNIAQYTDEALARSFVRIQLLSELHREIFTTLLFFNSNQGVFVPRTDYTYAQSRLLAMPRGKKFNFKETSLKESVTLLVDSTEKYTGIFSGWLNALNKNLDAEEERISNRLNFLKITVELNEQEAQLVNKSQQLDSLFENFSSSFYDALKSEIYVNSFINTKTRLMEKYAESSKNEKIELGLTTQRCLDSLLFLFQKSSEIERFEKEIYKTYHKLELNPVTWTEMEVTKYERIYNGYIDKLVPHLFLNLEQASKANCNTFLAEVYNFHKTLAFVLTLEEQAPHKINRKLRNSDSPEEYLEKIGYQR